MSSSASPTGGRAGERIDPFVGAWLVREYVFDVDGRRAGVVDQRRRLERGAGSRIRVLQDCEPSTALEDHPMARFAGHHAFELEVVGGIRRYLGPAVVGTGIDLGDGFMIGRGVWPAFGYNFTSFAVMVAPDRQITGGTFARAGDTAAVIVGVAGPELGEPPVLEGPASPGEVATTWRGSCRLVDAARLGDANPAAETRALRREYHGQRWLDAADGDTPEEMSLAPLAGAVRMTGTMADRPVVGFGKRYGSMLRTEVVLGPDTIVESMEILDALGGHLIGVRRWFVDHQLRRVETVRLRSEVSK